MSGVQIFTNVGLNQNNITGDAQGETATFGDNDKSLATTEFVQRVGLKFGDVITATDNTTLDATHLGRLIELQGSTPYTITLPDCSLFLNGSTYTLSCLTNQTITINTTSGQQIKTKLGLVTSTTLGNGDHVSLVKNSSNQWVLAGTTLSNTFLTGRTTGNGKFLFGNRIDDVNVGNCWLENSGSGITGDRVWTMIDTNAVMKVVRVNTGADPAFELQSWDDSLTTLRGFWDVAVVGGNLIFRDRTVTDDTFLIANRTNNTLSTAKTFTAANISGTNTGDQTITLTGDVTGSGTGSFAATISNAELSALKSLPNSAGYIRKTGTASYIIDTTMPVLSTLANGMPSFIETVGGKTVSIEKFEFEFGLSSNGTRNVYLQFVDDIVSSATIGRRIPDNMTLVGIYAQCTSVGNNGATAEVRVNGATTIASCPLVAGTMIYNLTSHSINLNAGDRIAVYGSAPTNNWANMIVKLIFRWRD